MVVTRAKIEISKLFARHTKKSLRAAEKFRDALLKELPDKRLNPIPLYVLSALNLKKPVVGVFRNPNKQQYQVGYSGADGKWKNRAFSWAIRDEVIVYSEAVRFREETIRDAV